MRSSSFLPLEFNVGQMPMASLSQNYDKLVSINNHLDSNLQVIKLKPQFNADDWRSIIQSHKIQIGKDLIILIISYLSHNRKNECFL